MGTTRFCCSLSLVAQGVPAACVVQVLHIDRNNYYGGETASLQLTQVRCIWVAWSASSQQEWN